MQKFVDLDTNKFLEFIYAKYNFSTDKGNILFSRLQDSQNFFRDLQNLQLLTKNEIESSLQDYFNVNIFRPHKYRQNLDPKQYLTLFEARLHQAVVFSKQQKKLLIALSNIFDLNAITYLENKFYDFQIEYYWDWQNSISKIIDLSYEDAFDFPLIISAIENSHNLEQSYQQTLNQLTLEDLFLNLIKKAVIYGATDIHFEPYSSYTKVRYRVNGVLEDLLYLPAKVWQAFLIKAKINAGMSITENRLPQDGQWHYKFYDETIDFRFATMPIIHGENLVIRVLEASKGLLPLTQLNLDEDKIILLRKLISRPDGLILVIGPTGSGKTSLLYSLLQELQVNNINIKSLEDPVEYAIAGINQSSIKPDIGFDFSYGMRTILRQDPDVILIGEIRDEPTAKIAIRAAMTGHLVFATIHAKDLVSVPMRLVELGISKDLIANNLTALINIRLMRLTGKLKLNTSIDKVKPILEILELDDNLQQFIFKPKKFLPVLKNNGFTFLATQAKQLLNKGEINLAEYQRVIG